MTDFFMDTDGGSSGNGGTSWADAMDTLENLAAKMSAGDRGWVQGAADDTAAASRTFTFPGTITNPCIVTGVVDGTTNEPPVLADLAVTLPKVSNTVAGSDLTYAGNTTYINMHFTSIDRFAPGARQEFIGCKISHGGLFIYSTNGLCSLVDCVREPTTTSGEISLQRNAKLFVLGGSVLFTAAATLVNGSSQGDADHKSVDLSGLTAQIGGRSTFANCKMPASFTLFSSPPTIVGVSIDVIASDNSSSVPSGDSIQDHQYADPYGTVDAEFTAVRTNGADDGASGDFSHAMTPHANATLESSVASLKSPWMDIWLAGGSNTVTIYIANDSASTDYNEDEVWAEFYTPDVGDTAQHDQTFDPADERLFPSTTAITDDTGSTWGTGANNHQKLSVTVTTGFEGEAQCRLHLAKRQATPDTLFLDPLPEVT